MVEPKPIQKGVYRHFKGGLYEVVDTVIDSETLETMVLYRPLGTQIGGFVRMLCSPRQWSLTASGYCVFSWRKHNKKKRSRKAPFPLLNHTKAA